MKSKLLRRAKCSRCGNVVRVKDFRHSSTLREFNFYSGLCQLCQDRDAGMVGETTPGDGQED